MNEYLPQTKSLSEEQTSEVAGEPPESNVRLLIADQQATLTIDESQIQAAVRAVFNDSQYHSGSVSIAVVDDPTIHEINRQYLEHNYPTDVLSFVLEDDAPYLEGELVVSADTAKTNATEYDWPAHHELLLYVLHGALHLVGYRDKQPEEIMKMRTAEAKYLRELGIPLPKNETRWSINGSTQESAGKVPPL